MLSSCLSQLRKLVSQGASARQAELEVAECVGGRGVAYARVGDLQPTHPHPQVAGP